jgi:copper resistance protein C
MVGGFRLWAAVLAAVVLSSGGAQAHAKLKSASPAAGDTAKTGLAAIELVFNETLEPALSTLELDDAQDKLLVTSKGTPACAGATCKLAVPPLAAGDYTVKYHVLSGDGHVVKGSFSFHVAD